MAIKNLLEDIKHLTEQTMKQKCFEAGVRYMLQYIGENPDREGLKDTPARVRRFFEEAMIPGNPPKITVFQASTKGQVIQRGIPFFTFCEHHLLPVTGHTYEN